MCTENNLLAPINDFICTNSYLLFIRCGYPCPHVLKVTNELTLEILKYNIGNYMQHTTNMMMIPWDLIWSYNFNAAIMKKWVYLF